MTPFVTFQVDSVPLERSNNIMIIEYAIVAFLSYLIGSIPSGLIVARVAGGADPRESGSGNIGATNVLRTVKGLVPVLAAMIFLPSLVNVVFFAAAGAILGHDFSIFLKFHGGKGVATTIGALMGINPALAGLCLITWVVVVAVTRYSSAGALVAGALSPVFAAAVFQDLSLTLFCAGAAGLLAFLHRENIRRLSEGTEKRVSLKSSPDSEA